MGSAKWSRASARSVARVEVAWEKITGLWGKRGVQCPGVSTKLVAGFRGACQSAWRERQLETSSDNAMYGVRKGRNIVRTAVEVSPRFIMQFDLFRDLRRRQFPAVYLTLTWPMGLIPPPLSWSPLPTSSGLEFPYQRYIQQVGAGMSSTATPILYSPLLSLLLALDLTHPASTVSLRSKHCMPYCLTHSSFFVLPSGISSELMLQSSSAILFRASAIRFHVRSDRSTSIFSSAFTGLTSPFLRGPSRVSIAALSASKSSTCKRKSGVPKVALTDERFSRRSFSFDFKVPMSLRYASIVMSMAERSEVERASLSDCNA